MQRPTIVRIASICLLCAITLSLLGGVLIDVPTVAAQVKDRDRDGDGVLDHEDRCPDQPGTAANAGCPDPTPVPPPPPPPEPSGSDGGSTPNDTGDTGVVQPPPIDPTTIPYVFLPEDGPCVVSAPIPPPVTNVNIREEPHTDALVIGQLSPIDLATVVGLFQHGPDSTDPGAQSYPIWLLVAHNDMLGWVAQAAVRQGGDCTGPNGNTGTALQINLKKVMVKSYQTGGAQNDSTGGSGNDLLIGGAGVTEAGGGLDRDIIRRFAGLDGGEPIVPHIIIWDSKTGVTEEPLGALVTRRKTVSWWCL